MIGRWLLLLGLGLLSATSALAHKPSDSYLTLRVAEPSGPTDLTARWDIALRDLEYAVGLDADHDGAITLGELRRARAAVFDYALGRLTLAGDASPCRATPGPLEVTDHVDGAYAALRFTLDCPAGTQRLRIDYQLLFDVDPSHRGLLQLRNGPVTRSRVFSAENHSATLASGQAAPLTLLATYVHSGARHIWSGADHLLFLLTLLLPAVLIRRSGRWTPRPQARGALREVLVLVTAFTLAHAVTLTLASLGWVSPASRVVETGIAVSILVMALDNLRPTLPGARWALAFGFGLIHGLGFAGVLAGLDLPPAALIWALAGFNLGVEAGQLAVVAALLPALLMLRTARSYQTIVLNAGSILIAAIAAVWIWTRGVAGIL